MTEAYLIVLIAISILVKALLAGVYLTCGLTESYLQGLHLSMHQDCQMTLALTQIFEAIDRIFDKKSRIVVLFRYVLSIVFENFSKFSFKCAGQHLLSDIIITCLMKTICS